VNACRRPVPSLVKQRRESGKRHGNDDLYALNAARTWDFTANAVADYTCAVGPVPASLNLNAEQDAYYTQYADANGLPVLGGNLVSAAALTHACETILGMMSLRQDLLAEMIANGTIAAVTGDGEGITQIPAYSDLDTVFPITGDTWDNRARGGLGATKARPVSSGTEEKCCATATTPTRTGACTRTSSCMSSPTRWT